MGARPCFAVLSHFPYVFPNENALPCLGDSQVLERADAGADADADADTETVKVHNALGPFAHISYVYVCCCILFFFPLLIIAEVVCPCSCSYLDIGVGRTLALGPTVAGTSTSTSTSTPCSTNHTTPLQNSPGRPPLYTYIY